MGVLRKVIGKNQKDYYEAETISEDIVIYPKLELDLKHLPEAREYAIGKDYEVTLKLKFCHLDLYKKQGTNEECGHAQFEIIGIAAHGESKKQDKIYPRKVNKK